MKRRIPKKPHRSPRTMPSISVSAAAHAQMKAIADAVGLTLGQLIAAMADGTDDDDRG